MDWLTWAVLLFLAGLGILGIAQLAVKKPKKRKIMTWIGLIAAVVFLFPVLGVANYGIDSLDNQVSFGGGQTLSAGNIGNGGSSSSGNVVATYQPTASYETQDKYSSTSVTGTSYYKKLGSVSGNNIVGGVPASTTAISNTESGSQYAYWVDNTTAGANYWVKPLIFTAGVTDNIVNKEVYNNGTGTMSVYDLVGKASATSGASNISMAGDAQANVEFTYQATNKKSAVPFGGVLVLEQNSSISEVSCTLDGSPLPLNTRFQVTYTASTVNHIGRQFELPYGFDDGTGQVKAIQCQYNNGASAAGTGVAYFASIIPADYYVSQAGDILLDTEKSADGSTTRTASDENTPKVDAFWGA